MTDESIKTILFLAANPTATRRLRLDIEVREIQEGLQRSGQRHQFKLTQQVAVRPQDVRRAMLDVRPQIVHFLGGGTRYAGLVLEDDSGREREVAPEAIASLFELFANQVECVIFNTCYSEIQAEAVSQHINYVIGTSQGIGDKAAIEFAIGFYDALGAGRSIEFAYKFGCNAIAIAGLAEHQIPIMKKKAVNKTIDLRQSLEDELAKDLKLLKILEDQLRVEADSARRYKVELEIKELKQRINKREIEIKAVYNNFNYQ